MTLSFPFTSFCISLLFFSVPLCSTLNSDGLSLLALKAAIETDPTRVLDSWSESDSTPCHWSGIVCTRNRVTQLALPNKGFKGYIPSELGHLNSLKRLSLAHNNFSKPIPSRLFDATTLIVLDLSHNSFSGQVPDQIKNLKNLRHLDLSSNLLNGSLPVSVVQLTDLVGTLNLSFNQFSGGVPASYGDLPVFLNLDLRHNNLTGKIPQVGSLLDQGPTAFYGNPGLCGFPLHALCPEAQNPRVFPKYPQNPNHSSPNVGDRPAKQKSGSGSVILSLISGVSVLVGVVSVSVWLLRRKGNSESEEGKTGKENIQGFEGVVVDEERQKGKFMLIDEGFDFELEDLLRASAYVVGKSWSGIVYKVVVRRERGSGVAAPTIVAVRRLSEGDATWRLKEFESEVEGIGRIQHPNIVRLRAYYYAHDEKLLVTDFIRNGNLWAKLHGNNFLSPFFILLYLCEKM